MDLAVGHMLGGRYRIIRRIGQGGMAAVYLASDTRLGVNVACKVLFPQHRSSPAVAARFRNEVVAARSVVHPAIIKIFDFVETDEALFITMEYVEGRDAKYLLAERGPFAVDLAVGIARQVAAGLVAAHERGVVHGDVKPHNILIDADERARLVDFGMARVNTVAGMTTHSLVLGTPEYAAPELFENRYIDARADVYSLGVVLFELVTGKLPFKGATPYGVIDQKVRSAPPSSREVTLRVPKWLDAVIAKAMAPAPEDRFVSAISLADALESQTAHILPALYEGGAEPCRHCGAQLLEGFSFCFACQEDTQFVRPTNEPGHAVVVLRKFLTETLDQLTYDQKYHVVSRIADARGRLDISEIELDQQLREPPFVVLDQLSREDARKLRDDLADRGITVAAIENDRYKLLRAVAVDPVARIAATLLGTLSAGLMLIALATGSVAFIVLAALTNAALFTSFLIPMWLKLRPIGHRRRRWRGFLQRWLRKRDAPPVTMDDRRARVAWLEPIARSVRGRVTSKHLERTLARLFCRAAAIEHTIEALGWLSDDATAAYRAQLAEALEAAGSLAQSIQQSDDFLAETDEAEIVEHLAHLERRLGEVGPIEEAAEVIEAKQSRQQLLADLESIERRRSHFYAELLALITRLDGLHAMLAKGAQSDADEPRRLLQAALRDLSESLEATAELES